MRSLGLISVAFLQIDVPREKFIKFFLCMLEMSAFACNYLEGTRVLADFIILNNFRVYMD